MQKQNATWHRSSYSGQNGECVEARHRAHDGIDLRDSKHNHGPIITIDTHSWTTFTTALQNGAFDAR
ncbi:DUF397 domain-containing protein [Streptomyces avicenniae]|uniref:DUF397 domain-containing protein n=1 Tax=Streptomyces avicenniae TaxID=500153 RepID=UPI00069BA50D|nr:DUF397 domain-containing protein [Streptomyces avicenniae]